MNALVLRVCFIVLVIHVASGEQIYASTPEETIVCIQPLGKYSQEFIQYIEKGITYLYGFQTRTLPAIPMPQTAYYEPRQRYKSQKIVEYLKEKKPKECHFVQGFTNQDISITNTDGGDYGVIGWANGFGGEESVVSTYRIKRFSSIDIRKLLVRTVNHEIGHMLGFRHHKRGECLMTEWKRTLDRESLLLCPETRKFIETTHNLILPVREPFSWKEILE